MYKRSTSRPIGRAKPTFDLHGILTGFVLDSQMLFRIVQEGIFRSCAVKGEVR